MSGPVRRRTLPSVDVCLTPEISQLYEFDGRVVVVADIFRFTSCAVTAIAHGVKAIIPFDDIESCLLSSRKGMVTGGERDGKKIKGFDLGNSPSEYSHPRLKGRTLAITTTNGTKTLKRIPEGCDILIGSFLNMEVSASYICSTKKPTLVVCAGWRGRPCLEDTLFAGALIDRLSAAPDSLGDEALLAWQLYKGSQGDLASLAMKGSHGQRIRSFGHAKDLSHCLQQGLYDTLVTYSDGQIRQSGQGKHLAFL